jgi:hypothetical protein
MKKGKGGRKRKKNWRKRRKHMAYGEEYKCETSKLRFIVVLISLG